MPMRCCRRVLFNAIKKRETKTVCLFQEKAQPFICKGLSFLRMFYGIGA